MSKAFLKKLLDEELGELAKLADEFNPGVPLLEHHLTISVENIKAEIYAAIKGTSSKEADAIIDSYARQIVNAIYSKFRKDVVGTPPKFIIVTVFRSEGSIFRKIGGRTRFIGEPFIFDEVRASFRRLQSALEKELNSLVDISLSEGTKIKKRPGPSEFAKTDPRYVTITLTKRDTRNTTSFKSTIQSSDLNIRGAQKAYLQALTKAVRILDSRLPAGEWRGSDSRSDMEGKKIIATFENKIKPGKNVRKTKTNTKIKTSTASVSKTIKPKIKRSKAREKLVQGLDVTLRGIDPISLVNLINKQIVKRLAANMALPRLRYRTGRFAHSVRALKVSTQREQLVIEYTYMKYPYQTFEPGFKQGSVERDPRSLIDLSIRQIVQDAVKQKFSTRRL